jgi:hypothetical protein
VAKAKGSSIFVGFSIIWVVGSFVCLGCFVVFGFLCSLFPVFSFFLVFGVLVYTSSVL